jgi:peptidoglycan/LPS O-acetylase OafA/YrhL
MSPCHREVLGKLSYGVYLIHPIVLQLLYWSRTQPTRYSAILLGFDFAGTWVLSHAIAAVLFVFVEKPFLDMESVLFKRMHWS